MADASELPFFYLTTTGRKTGLPREIEIWFVADGGRFYVLAEHFERAHWVQNIRKEPRVRVRLGGREFPATARVLDQESWERVQALARAKYGWGEGLPVEITPEEGGSRLW